MMLHSLANTLEKLDLSLEHIIKGDANNARFGLMLTDNAVEITLHQIAVDSNEKIKRFAYKRERYGHMSALERALGRHFVPKLKFARIEGRLSGEITESIAILHEFRNEVYHIGIRHEPVLPALAVFYFKLACDFLADYEPPFLMWSFDLQLPERAKKFFAVDNMFPGSIEQYRSACHTLGNSVSCDPSSISKVLAGHMSQVIEEVDSCIDLVATGGPNRSTRDRAVIDTQAWKLAFSEQVKEYAREQGWRGGVVLKYVEWLADNYPLQFRSDPIPAWRSRARSLTREINPHKALKRYRSFMDQTAAIRENLYEAASQVEAYIDEQIERMKLERRLANRV